MVNNRVFEVLASGGRIFMPWYEGLEVLVGEGVGVEFYRGEEDVDRVLGRILVEGEVRIE